MEKARERPVKVACRRDRLPESGQCVRVREAHRGAVQSLKVSPDGSTMASCGDDRVITLWNLERLDITGIRGLTQAQKATLRALGAVEDGA